MLKKCCSIVSHNIERKKYVPLYANNIGTDQPASKLLGTLIEIVKEFFEKVNFEKSQQMTKKHEKFIQLAKS